MYDVSKLQPTEVARKTVGYSTVMNTNHPRVLTVTRSPSPTRVDWCVTLVCNGIAEYFRKYQTKRDAMGDYGDWTEAADK